MRRDLPFGAVIAVSSDVVLQAALLGSRRRIVGADGFTEPISPNLFYSER